MAQLVSSRISTIALMMMACSAAAYAASTPTKSEILKPKAGCATMAGKSIPAEKIALATKGAKIESATLEPAGDPNSPPAEYVPEICRIEGTIAPVDPSAPPINFRLSIPTEWNGKAIQIGGNGMDGFVPNLGKIVRNRPGSPLGPAFPPDAPNPNAKNYATFGSDSGHGGARPPDQTINAPTAAEAQRPRQQPQVATPQGPPPGMALNWMANDESFKNFAYEQIKKTHDVALEIISQMYGTKPRITYFMGESQGGREALMAATRFGADYDGVLSSVPLAYFTGVMLSPAYRLKLQVNPGTWVPPAKAAVVAKEVLAQCDKLDGLEDGVINNYYACNRLFDPSITKNPLAKIRCADGKDTGDDCLSDAQLATVDAFHAPMKWGFPMLNGETDWVGEPAGSEGGKGSGAWVLTREQPSVNMPAAGPTGVLTSRYGDSEQNNIMKRDFSQLQTQIQGLSQYIDAPADLSKLLAHGGKFILHSANNDYVTNPRNQMRFFEQLTKKHGEATIEKSARYYVTPNANHGSIGFSATSQEPQARYMDLVSYLENWVENGKVPPDAIPQMLKDDKPPFNVVRARPLCRYPKYPQYDGKGDPSKMESYSCTSPNLSSRGQQ